MRKQRVNILTSVNAANVSRDGDTYTVRDVVHAVDGIVLNRRLYVGEELAKSVSSLNGKPVPAGHPRDRNGRHISASNGEALAAAWIGAYCVNSRYEGGRAVCDVVINAAQARALPAGQEVVSRLDAAIAGTNAEPIPVSSGLMLREVAANGESRGKRYASIATDIQFDHLAILLKEKPAGSPDEGIGMFVNADGEEQQVEVANLDHEPADVREHNRLTAWIKRLLGNAEMSFSDVSAALQKSLPDGSWLVEVYDTYAVWAGRDNRLWKQAYTTANGSVAWDASPEEVSRRVTYEPLTNSQHHEESDAVKDHIVAALNAAGITTQGLDDAQLLTAYNALVTRPVSEKLDAVNAKLAEREAADRAAEEAEATRLAEALAVNSALSADDLKKLGAARLRELSAKAAPVVPGKAGGARGDEFASYSINALIDEKKEA